jgi:hypothetical protein
LQPFDNTLMSIGRNPPGIMRAVERLACAALLLLLGCGQRSECERACLRVARCKQEAREGAPILGERPPPADERCMKRCQEQPDVFQACEAKNRTCEELRNCYGPLTD